MEILRVENLNIRIGNEDKIAGGSFCVESGNVILLSGPNGCGKSTIIKLIMGDLFDYKDINYSTQVLYHETHDILKSENEHEAFRIHVCYVSQDDLFESDNVLECFMMAINYEVKSQKEQFVYDFIRKYDIQECFGIENVKMDRESKKLIRKLGLNEEGLDDKERRTIRYLTMKIKRMSGGQKKLTNIMTNLIRFEFCDLLLFDEPLNNLDYSNVRSFSNVLTRIYRTKPELGIVLVTHCRSIPIVNKVVQINPLSKKIEKGDVYQCSSCFGSTDEQGFYI